MLMKRIFLFILFIFTLLKGSYAQQDAQYSMYMFNNLALNPAYAGSREVLATALIYRDQWTGMQGQPTTASFSIQSPLSKKNVGVGAEIISDRLGPQSINAILFSYAYRLNFLKGKLALGLRLGMYDYVTDWSKIDYKDKTDVYNTGNRSSKITGTGDFGTYYYTRTFYWGLGWTHLNNGKIADVAAGGPLAKQSVHFFMPIGKAFETGSVVLNPNLLIKSAKNAPSEIDLGLNVLLKDRLWLGFSLRSGYGMVLLTQFLITDKMKVGYSYDHGTNQIGTIGKGSHEIMIGYDLNVHGTKMLMPRYM